MADQYTPMPVKSKNNGDVVVALVDTAGVNKASVSAAGAVKVDNSGVTQPVSGTVTVQDGGGSITVDNGGTFLVQDNQVVADNGPFTDGTTKVFVNGYIYDEVAGTALTENDAAAGRINVNRAQVGTIEDGATRGRYATVTAANAVKTDGSAVTQPVSDAGGSLTVDDGAGSLTVDAPVGTPVFVRLSDGAAAAGGIANPLYVTPVTSVGTLTDSGTLTSAALAAGASANLDTAAITTGTARLVEITASSSVRTKVEVQSGVAGATAHRVFFVEANQSFVYKVPDSEAIKFTGAASKIFRLKITNMDNANAADVYGSISYTN